MALPIQSIEESLSIAYVSAICSKAGATVSPVPQDYGVDLSVRNVRRYGTKFMDMGVAFDCQLKATINWSEVDNHIVYDVEVDTYNKLVFRKDNSMSPCLLVVLCLPRESDEWVSTSNDGLTLKKSCYFYHIHGKETLNKSKRRIKIPIENRLTPELVNELIDKSTNGELQ